MAYIAEKKSVLEMARGAIMEKVDVEIDRVMGNIMDPNTPPKAKRRITLTLDFMPSDNRQRIDMRASCKSTLAPYIETSTALCITKGRKGELLLTELLPQIPGQLDVDGGEAPEPAFARIGH